MNLSTYRLSSSTPNLRDKLRKKWSDNSQSFCAFNAELCVQELQGYLSVKRAEYKKKSSFGQFFSSYKQRKLFLAELVLLLRGYLATPDEDKAKAEKTLSDKFAYGLNKFHPELVTTESYRFFERLYWHHSCLTEVTQKQRQLNNKQSQRTLSN